MRIKETPTNVEILEIFKKRWSTRAFDINKPIEREKLIAICEAARWSPSSMNDQPYKFIIWNKFHNEEQYNKALSCLGEWNYKWAKTAPVLVAAIANTKFRYNQKFNRWAEFDTGSATMSMILQATTLDIMSHQMGGFDVDKLKLTFGISDDFVPMSMIAFGYQSEDINVIDVAYHDGEIKPRERLDLSSNFYDSNFGNGIIPLVKDNY